MEEEAEKEERIPEFLRTEEFIAARFKEISILSNMTGKNNRVTSIFQRLPKRMRRRAMSHTVKRVPRNLRDAHRQQLEKNNALKKRKKSSKYHRRRCRSSAAYEMRKRKVPWLETHIWHAKRFRMHSIWNYKIAERSYEKTFRASYRAMKSHCLLQDISYYCCIEIADSLQRIADGFRRLTSPECGPSVTAKCWLSGNREGSVILYQADCYPRNVIGKVTIMWKSPTDANDSFRILWIWCHPAYHDDVVEQLINVFSLSDMSEMLKIRKYENVEFHTKVTLLKDTLNRFRLMGPLSNSVLTESLHSAELFDRILKTGGASDDTSWWPQWKSPREVNNEETALELLKKYPYPSQFPSNSLLSAHIIDPRLFIKRKRTKAVITTVDDDFCHQIPPLASASSGAIWEMEIRENVARNMVKTATLNEFRSSLAVPGFDEQLLSKINTVIPIMLVQRSVSRQPGFGCGWDLIVPKNWAMPVWLSLILNGARPGALRETKTFNLETNTLSDLFPDANASISHYNRVKQECEDLYFKKAPNKRVNFIKLAIPFPFHCPWDIVTKDWFTHDEPDSYFVLRNRRELIQLRDAITNIDMKKINSLLSNFNFSRRCLIPVAVTTLNTGCLSPFSHICLPSKADLCNRRENVTFSGPIQTVHDDDNKQKRKNLRTEHTKLLKRLRRMRIKEKRLRLLKGLPSRIIRRKCSPTEEIVKEYLKENRVLCVPSQVASVRQYCDREICGFVLESGFSFLKAHYVGHGYITSESFRSLLNLQIKADEKNCAIVLTRSSDTLNYRFCSLNVIVS